MASLTKYYVGPPIGFEIATEACKLGNDSMLFNTGRQSAIADKK